VLNTLRISVAGIVAATILGTLIGIARLSSNWIVSKLATVYVEAVRNVPLALFVIAGLLVVVLGVFPTIQDAWDLAGLMIISNRGCRRPVVHRCGPRTPRPRGDRPLPLRGWSPAGGRRCRTAPVRSPGPGCGAAAHS
jgi:His/Glu/Gln/Arg/opine family amino acid ABC transporter permease subunit